MLLIPKGETVRLTYARTWADAVGWLLTVGTVALCVWRWRRRGRTGAEATSSAETSGESQEARSLRWGGAIPVGLLALLAASRLLPTPGPDSEELFRELSDRASQAYAEERFADAAEYLRHALAQDATADERAGAHCLRGESLLREGRLDEAEESFNAAIAQPGVGAYTSQAWFGLVRAREAAGNVAGAAQAREMLIRDFPDTPWAQMPSPGGSGE
jgi:tetratricopeptide (TPR) repeat protein